MKNKKLRKQVVKKLRKQVVKKDKNKKNKNKQTIKQETKKETKTLEIVKTDKIFSIIMEKIGFIHIDKDEDGLYDGLVVPKTHANYLFYTSFFSLLSSMFLFYKKSDNYIYTLSIFITSLNYWRNPIYNWRRNIDMIVIFVSFFVIGIKFYIQSKLMDVLPTTIISFLFYLISNYFQEKYIHISTFFHSLIHIYPNIKFIQYEMNKDE
jgi:uncharacterized membrane protein YjjP (DUF1212 family)